MVQAVKDVKMKLEEELVRDLLNPDLRGNALSELAKKRDTLPDLAPLIWYSFGTVTVLLQEIVSIYPTLSPPTLSASESNQACNVLALFQSIASHPETRTPFLEAGIAEYLYPFLNTTSTAKSFEYLRLTSLGVVGALVKGNSYLNFRSKPWIGKALAWEKTQQSRHLNKVFCMSVQQASKSKVAVKPVELEDPKEPPLNLYKPKEPYTATIVSVERIVGPKAPGEICHIVIDHGGNVPYWEGQSYGVIPPGENPKKPGFPNTVRLYSIASTRYGDSFDGKTASLCVRRAVYYDPETGKEDPSKNGICSNFLCDSKPGDKVQITGPSGKILLLPEDDPNATHIMIATGTGVAPYRGYLRRMFMEDVPTFKFGGLAWLFLGVANSDSLLYDEEFTNYLQQYPDNFRYDKALSREQKNKNGGKMYVQDKIEEYSDEIFKLLDGGVHIYFCGLKGMMPGIQDTLKRVAEQRGESWDQKLSQLKKNKQWHVEVY